MAEQEDGTAMAGKHRRNALCNRCGKAEGDPGESGSVTLIIDLEEYSDADRIWQSPRSPDNPLPQFMTWCTDCARQILLVGDPITDFREFGYPDNSPDGPYAQMLAKHGLGIRFSQ